MRTKLIAVVLALAAAALPVAALPAAASSGQTWFLENVTFDDGATATGTFHYDAASGTYSAIDITVSGGIGGTTAHGAPNPGSSGTELFLSTVAAVLPDLTGERATAFTFAAPLTSAGGSIDLVPGPSSFEGTCLNATCSGALGGPFSDVTGGRVTTTPTWYLQGVTFDDGAIATGTFTFDAVDGTITAVDITVSGGAGGTTTHVAPNPALPGNEVQVTGIEAVQADLTGLRALVLELDDALWSGATTVDLLVGPGSIEATCADATCTTVDPPISTATAGSVTTLLSPPQFTSPANPAVPENQNLAADVEATDDNGDEPFLTYALTGGADQSLFAIDPTTGVVTFVAAPDFEAPSDADLDNTYEIEVTVTDPTGLSASQAIAVTVTDEDHDQFAEAIALAVPSSTDTGNNTTFTSQVDEPVPSCGLPAGRSAWWSFTPVATDGVAVDTFGSAIDTHLTVYTGTTLATLTEVACNDDFPGGGTQSRVEFTASAGTTYWVRVDGAGGAAGDLTVTLSTGNDSFSDAHLLTGPNDTAAGTNVGYSTEPGEPQPSCLATATHSAWWTFTAAATGDVTVDTAGSDFDTLLAAYTGTAVDDLTEVACNDDDPVGGGVTSRVRFKVTAGTQYWLQVDGFGTATGTISITLSPTPVIRPYGSIVNPEGDSGSTVTNVPVFLEDSAGNVYSGLTHPVTVDWRTTDIPSNPKVAKSGEDYVAANGSLTFTPGGATTQTVPISVLGDTVDEPPLLYGEWGIVVFSNPSANALLDTSTFFGVGLFIIIDDD